MPSTVIAAFHYEAAKKILTVVFTTGKVYEYFNVPENIYLAMKNAFSKGIYFNAEVKDKYNFKRKDG